jgi:hypothetical protein
MSCLSQLTRLRLVCMALHHTEIYSEIYSHSWTALDLDVCKHIWGIEHTALNHGVMWLDMARNYVAGHRRGWPTNSPGFPGNRKPAARKPSGATNTCRVYLLDGT